MDDSSPQGERRFAEVYADNVARVFSFIGYRVPTKPEAEDLTQAVFEKALRAWGRFDPERGSEITWLIAIARNVLIDHSRRRRDALLPEGELPDTAAEPGLDQRGLSAELAAAVARLQPREQTALALRYGAELSGREIAELLELSTDNVHQILSRALRRLRAELEGG